MSENNITMVQAACGHTVPVIITDGGSNPERDLTDALSSICGACQFDAAEAAQAEFDAQPLVHTEQITIRPNTITRVTTGLLVVAPIAGASVVNGVFGASDMLSTNPTVMAANARIKGSVTTMSTNAVLSMEMAKLRHNSDEAVAARAARKEKVGSFLKKVGNKVAAAAPVKVVLEQGKLVADDVKAFVDSTDQPITITIETQLCKTCQQPGSEDNPVLGNGICEGCNEAHDIDHDPDNFSIHD